MAFTVSNLAKTVFGNMRVGIMRVTADAATGTVATGLKYIYSIATTVQSAATLSGNSGVPRFAINELAAGTTSKGTIGISQTVSGDEFIITAFGR